MYCDKIHSTFRFSQKMWKKEWAQGCAIKELALSGQTAGDGRESIVVIILMDYGMAA